MNWHDMMQTYLERLERLGRSHSTLDSARRALREFLAICELHGAAAPAQLTSHHLALYRRSLQETYRASNNRRLGASGVANFESLVRQFLRWAHGEGLLFWDLTASWTIPRPPQALRTILTEKQVAALLATPDLSTPKGLRDRAVLELLYGTGIRREECVALNLADLDLARDSLQVRQGKGGRARHLPVGPSLKALLERYLAESRPTYSPARGEPALLLNRGGMRLGAATVANIVESAGHQAGVKGVTPHLLRHAFACHLLDAGAELAHIKALLGHANLSPTQIYTRLHPHKVFREHRRTHPRA